MKSLDAAASIRRDPLVYRYARRYARFLSAYSRAIGSRVIGPIALFLVTVTISGMALTTVAPFWAEQGVNPQVESAFDALYLTVATMTSVGYGDVAPITTAGRVFAMLAMLFGTAIFAGFTALFASAIVEVGRSDRLRASDSRR